MTFKLSARSEAKLEGLDPRLTAVVKQKALVASGASQTMKSKHLQGYAVDLMAYIGSRASWELNLYDDIADAMAEAAREVDVPIRRGAAWTISNIAQFHGGTMEDAMNSYIDERRTQGRRPFIDGPHFELMV